MKQTLAHNILVGLCQVKNESSSLIAKENPITPRVNYIIDTILDLGLYDKVNMDTYLDGSDKTESLFYLNVELTFDMGTETSIMFVAHHDVNNHRSDNCQDNSASVSNLLALADHFQNNPPEKTVRIVFTDCEEFGGEGAGQLSRKIINGDFGIVEYVVNLELTANGRNLWADSENFTTESPLLTLLNEKADFYSAKTPFNDSVVLRRHEIDSVCIGSLTDRDMAEVKGRGYCKTWALCHKLDDTINEAVADDMDNFVEFLTKLV